MKLWLCAALLLAVAITAHSVRVESELGSESLSALGALSSAEEATVLSLDRAPKPAAKSKAMAKALPKKKKATEAEKAQTKETLKIAKLEPHEHTPVAYNALGLAPHPKIAINATDPEVVALFKSVSTAWGVVRSLSYNTAARGVKGLHTIAFGYDHAGKTPLVTLRFKNGKLPKAVPKALTHASFKVVMSEKKNALKFLSKAAPAPAAPTPSVPVTAPPAPVPAVPGSPLNPVNASTKPKEKPEKRVPLLNIGDQVDRKRKNKVLGEKTVRKHGSSVGACLQGFTKSKKRGDYFLSSWHGVKNLTKLVLNEFGNKVGVVSAVNPKGYRRESDMDVVFMHKKDRCKCTKKVPGYKVFKNRAAFAAAVVFLGKSDAMKRVHLTSNGAGHRRTRKGWINAKRIFESSVVEYPEDKPLKEKKYPTRKASASRKRKGKKNKKGKKAEKKKKNKKTEKKKGKKVEKKKKGKKVEKKKKGKKSEKKKKSDKKKKDAKKKKGKKNDKKKKDPKKKKGKKTEKQKKGKKSEKKKKKSDKKKKGKKKGKKSSKNKGGKNASKAAAKKKTKPRRLRFRGFMRVQYAEEQQPVQRDSGGPLYLHDILVGFASAGDEEGANFSPIWAVNDVLPSHLKNRFC